MCKEAIIFFTRIPTPNKTKTRLQQLLGTQQCCLLQAAFIQDIFQILQKVDADIFVCYGQDGDLEDLQALLPQAQRFFPQDGADLGEKMHNAIQHVLEAGYERCLLVGSDIPLLTAQVFEDALALLATHDMVLGPTEDGGYYLVGLKQPCYKIFDLKKYGTASVFDETVAIAHRMGLNVAQAAIARDIDEPHDLHWLMDKPVGPATMKILGELRV